MQIITDRFSPYINVWEDILKLCGVRDNSLHCTIGPKALSSIPGLYPLNVSSAIPIIVVTTNIPPILDHIPKISHCEPLI